MRTPHDDRIDRAFRVSLSAHLFGGLIHGWRSLWVKLGDLESAVLRERMRTVRIDRPVYVAGLARSGSTILLEVLAGHPQVVTHRYRDFPPVFTPYWWQEILRRGPQAPSTAVERTHGDGLMVGPESPEAMEEAIWMAFFPHLHTAGTRQVLDGETANPAFERFYADHVRKLLLSRGGSRYVSKGNYNVSRLRYLLKLFPDARFVIPVRHPRTHIASLMKQQRSFVEGETRHPRARDYMRRVGHFEFGLDRHAIDTGDSEVIASVHDLWRRGEEVRGWARYWACLYGWLADRLAEDATLREASLVVRFEDLCDRPRETLGDIFAHAELNDAGLPSEYAERVHAPTYYKPTFTADEERVIVEETRTVAERYGYGGDDAEPSVAESQVCASV